MQDFRNLDVWTHAYRLTLAIYKATASFPREELYGVTSQIRRAATSIAANIAKGCGRQTDRDFSRFLYHAMGSASELECHLLLTHDLGMLDLEQRDNLLNDLQRTRRMLNSLIQRIKVSEMDR